MDILTNSVIADFEDIVSIIEQSSYAIDIFVSTYRPTAEEIALQSVEDEESNKLIASVFSSSTNEHSLEYINKQRDTVEDRKNDIIKNAGKINPISKTNYNRWLYVVNQCTDRVRNTIRYAINDRTNKYISQEDFNKANEAVAIYRTFVMMFNQAAEGYNEENKDRSEFVELAPKADIDMTPIGTIIGEEPVKLYDGPNSTPKSKDEFDANAGRRIR